MLGQELLPSQDFFHLNSFQVSGNTMIFQLSAKKLEAFCPRCSTKTTRIHSRYLRHPADVACSGRTVRFVLQTHRYFCENIHCSKRTFSQKFPNVLESNSRRTERLRSQQERVALFLSCEAASRLLFQLSIPTSPDTLLRIVRQKSSTPAHCVRVLGVDDWAFRRGHRYGTILVDLEKHKVIEMLPDRTAESLEEYLRKHPELEIVTRDRSKEYAKGISKGAPQAQQVADRWHLWMNMKQALERFLLHKYQELKSLPELETSEATLHTLEVPLRFPRSAHEENAREAKKKEKILLYQEVQRRRNLGESIRGISFALKINRATARKYFDAEKFPERVFHRRRGSLLDPFLPYMERRFAEGCENASQIWKELQSQGFSGASKQVLRWVQVRRTLPAPSTAKCRHRSSLEKRQIYQEKQGKTACKDWLPSAKSLASLLMRDVRKRSSADESILSRILQDTRIKESFQRAQEFASMLREKKAKQLDEWLELCKKSKLKYIRDFAKGIEQEKSAVFAAFSMSWSNGQAEGQINRLKLLKRQMFGRANFDLLKRRVMAEL